jgi:hypothetical protein
MVAGRWAFAQNRHALILINQARKFASFEKGGLRPANNRLSRCVSAPGDLLFAAAKANPP